MQTETRECYMTPVRLAMNRKRGNRPVFSVCVDCWENRLADDLKGAFCTAQNSHSALSLYPKEALSRCLGSWPRALPLLLAVSADLEAGCFPEGPDKITMVTWNWCILTTQWWLKRTGRVKQMHDIIVWKFKMHVQRTHTNKKTLTTKECTTALH